MTIAQIQGLKAFAQAHLIDTVDWARDVREDPDQKTTGDQAFILIKTPFNRYRMSICSTYIEPPPGAPFACKSLGTVTFHDLADNKRIVGPKSDNTWTEIAKHVNAREMTDAIAAARRELAEAPAEQAPAVRAKFADLVKRAERHGVKATIPAEGAAPFVQAGVNELQSTASQTTVPTEWLRLPDYQGAIANPFGVTGDAPWLGAPIIYITNPGEQISGMQEIVGWVVKVMSHDKVSIFITPDNTEPRYCDNLPRRGTPAGNGRMHQFNCWDFNSRFMALLTREQSDEAVQSLRKNLGDLAEICGGMDARIAMLETKRNPGRPPKTTSEAGKDSEAA